MNKELEIRIKNEANPKKAKILQGFFKTGKGEYGEGDVFLGITVPIQRKIAKEFKEIDYKEIQELIESKIHEKRLIGILILIEKFKNSEEKEKKQIFEFYIKNSKNVNNWDLVDLSAEHIVGDYLFDKPKDILYSLAKSENLWQRRISIVSTFAFIRKGELKDTLKIANILINDKQELIHKAVGWMLREVGKKDEKI